MTETQTSHPVTDFDHHDPAMVDRAHAVFSDLREHCPVAKTEAHGGFWVLSDYDAVQLAARNDELFSSANNLANRRGISIPPMPARAGIIETDAPRFTQLRKLFVPWFSPGAAEARRGQVEALTHYCIDQVIESGACDLTKDITAPIPAMLTMLFLGFPASDSVWMGDLFHRHSYLPPESPERAEVERDVISLAEQMRIRALERRANPRDDFMSFLATIEIAGELLTLDEIAEEAFLVLSGGIDTTTVLLTNTLLYLNDKPQLRAQLLADKALMATAFEEFLRYFSPIQGLARTVTRDCEFAGVHLKEDDRVWLSWASANLDESIFPDAGTIDLCRSPNRHMAFGVGTHRCLGANLAKVAWHSAITAILQRMSDYRIDLTASERYHTIGIVNGWIGTPTAFTPGERIGAELP